MPQRDRDSLQMLRAPPMAVEVIESSTTKQPLRAALIDEIWSGLTHNQLQALLGVWRR